MQVMIKKVNIQFCLKIKHKIYFNKNIEKINNNLIQKTNNKEKLIKKTKKMMITIVIMFRINN